MNDSISAIVAAPAWSPGVERHRDRGRVRCRMVAPSDLPAVLDLLCAGFPRRGRAYWAAALDCLAEREVPEGFPRFGQILLHDDRPVGVLLLICSSAADGIRCNVSSWFVRPEFRHLASLLKLPRMDRADVTLINTSPADNTLPIIEAQGFRPVLGGMFLAVPALVPRLAGRMVRWESTAELRALLPRREAALLCDHARRGCIARVVEDREGLHPFLFRARMIEAGLGVGWLPCAQLIYAAGLDRVARFAGTLGRDLALRGLPLLLIGANGPVGGLPGRFFRGRGVTYGRGPAPPGPGDLAYTEGALFGV